jgi:hypothetical protein
VINAQTVASYKRERGIPYLEVILEHWIPDRLPNKAEVPLGLRNSLKDRTQQSYPFMLTECVIDRNKMSFITKSSKVWPGTEVLEIKDQMHFDLMALSVDDENKGLWVNYLNALGVRLVLGVNDWADRNFIYRKDKEGESYRLISIDEDVLGKEISQTVLPRNKYEKVKQVLIKYHREVHRDVIYALTTYFCVSIERVCDHDIGRDREGEKKQQNAKKRAKPSDEEQDVEQEVKKKGEEIKKKKKQTKRIN